LAGAFDLGHGLPKRVGALKNGVAEVEAVVQVDAHGRAASGAGSSSCSAGRGSAGCGGAAASSEAARGATGRSTATGSAGANARTAADGDGLNLVRCSVQPDQPDAGVKQLHADEPCFGSGWGSLRRAARNKRRGCNDQSDCFQSQEFVLRLPDVWTSGSL